MPLPFMVDLCGRGRRLGGGAATTENTGLVARVSFQADQATALTKNTPRSAAMTF